MGILTNTKHQKNHHVCTRCRTRQEGPQGTRCPPQVLCDDRYRHHHPEGPHWLLPPGHPQVHCCQQQGRCCQGCRPGPSRPQAWSCQGSSQDGQSHWYGSWILQAGQGCQAKEGQEGKEACCQEGQEAKEGCQEARCQEGCQEARCQEASCQEACCQEASCQKASCQEGRTQEEVNYDMFIYSVPDKFKRSHTILYI